MQIKVSKNDYATIDAEDAVLVRSYTWWLLTKAGLKYAYTQKRINGKQVTILLHRLVMSADPSVRIDHRDRDGLNCQKSNLRVATQSQNMANASKHWDGSSDYIGVCWDKSKNRWLAHLGVRGRFLNLGRFRTAIEAAKVRDAAALVYFGEFANLNFPEEL